MLLYITWFVVFSFFMVGIAGFIRYYAGIGMKFFVVERKIFSDGWQENCGETVYRAFNEKHLKRIFEEEQRQFAHLRLRCRLEHRIIEKE